jgi:pSer/pThr/pTyr-binding forkhead associated (FHA) protein
VAESASLILPDGTERPLAPEFAVGRAEDNDLTIEKPTVSRHHLVVSEEGDRWFVEDRGSFNGTFLNGSRIQAGTATGSAWVRRASSSRRPARSSTPR